MDLLENKIKSLEKFIDKYSNEYEAKKLLLNKESKSLETLSELISKKKEKLEEYIAKRNSLYFWELLKSKNGEIAKYDRMPYNKVPSWLDFEDINYSYRCRKPETDIIEKGYGYWDVEIYDKRRKKDLCKLSWISHKKLNKVFSEVWEYIKEYEENNYRTESEMFLKILGVKAC